MSYSSSYILFILFILLSYLAFAQGNGTISVGSSLTPADTPAATSWYSPSGEFVFGFRKVQDQFFLSIWYDKIPDRTIVWYVNDGSTVPAGSKVQLTADRGLILSDSKRNEIWKSMPFSGTASNASFNDTVNFEIVGSDSLTLWDTFSNPTDTLLPTQILGVDGKLYSRRTETNFTRGRFQLRLLNDGNLVLNTRNILTDSPYDAYYRSDTFDTNTSNQGYQVKFNETGYMYVLRRNGDIVELTNNKAIPSTGYYHRATLTYDGILVQYYHPKVFTGTTGWTSVWQEPENICTSIREFLGGGPCGFNSICKFDGSRKDCECPETYSLLDPNDKHGGCKPNFTQNCDRNDSTEDLYDFVEIPGTDWHLSDYERMRPISEPECKRLCLIDCFCVAAHYEEDACWKKKLPLGNGRKNNSVIGNTFLKVIFSENIGQINQFIQGTLILVGSVLLGSSVFVNFPFGFFYIYHRKTINLRPANNILETNVCHFTNNELVEATNGFKEELGRGSFGIVYKGVIHTSSTVIVAVKKIGRQVQDGSKEFRTEVNAIAQTLHKNLVRLIGFCEEHRLLVYDYMVNGTLATFIFGSVKPSWAKRKHIATGIEGALAYLDKECNTRIIHCDIKPQNILRDEYYNARISDFELAKLLMLNQSRTNSGIRGTKGYVHPNGSETFRSLTRLMYIVLVFCCWRTFVAGEVWRI